MDTEPKNEITVMTTVDAPVKKVWDYWNNPEHIVNWSYASEEWHTPKAQNDLRTGGVFSSRMEAKDGSMGFDFGGTYDAVDTYRYIEYTLGDGRKVKITFTSQGDQTNIVETFEAEDQNPHEMQQAGWQAILNNFKKYTEAN